MTYAPRQILEFAEEYANRYSDDPKTKVGCYLFSNENPIGCGANRLPVNLPEIDMTTDNKHRYILHAEEWAVLFRDAGKVNRAFVTHAPCERCARILAAVGVKEVHSLHIHKGSDLRILFELGITFFLHS